MPHAGARDSAAKWIIADLRRLEGKHPSPTFRQLETLGRFGDPVQLVIELTPEGYRSIGNREEVAAAMAGPSLLDAAPRSEQEAMTAKELRDAANATAAVELSEAAVKRALPVLVKSGKLRRKGRGRRGDPHAFWKDESELEPDSDSVQP